MPCNPAVGGTAKGHLVREIDALGGLMGLAIDATGIQFKLLNRSRGPAVWSPRAQADKRGYREWVTAELKRHQAIHWIIGRAGRILVDHGRVTGVALEAGDRYACDALVVTTGTFLNGLIHVGPEMRPAGRAGEPASHQLAEALKALGFSWGRLKTRHATAAGSAKHRLLPLRRGAGRSPSGALLVYDGSAGTGPRCRAIYCIRTNACVSSCAPTSTSRRSSTAD